MALYACIIEKQHTYRDFYMKTFKIIITITFFVLLAKMAFAKEYLPGPYIATVKQVIDGDTFEAKIKVWLGQDVVTRVRLRNIDTPEIKGKCQSEIDLAERAKETMEKLTKGQSLVLTNISFGKYGNRIIANAHVGPSDVSEVMIKSGLAQKYNGGKRQSWCT